MCNVHIFTDSMQQIKRMTMNLMEPEFTNCNTSFIFESNKKYVPMSKQFITYSLKYLANVFPSNGFIGLFIHILLICLLQTNEHMYCKSGLGHLTYALSHLARQLVDNLNNYQSIDAIHATAILELKQGLAG